MQTRLTKFIINFFMSHGHSHHPVEENPKTASSGALYFVLLIVGLVLSLFLFVQSMSGGGHDDHAATAHHDANHAEDKGHGWEQAYSLDYSSNEISGDRLPKVEVVKVAPVVSVATVDSNAVPTTDTSKVAK